MFNVILFTDTAEFSTKTRGYGVHRLASHIRKYGYSCLVIDFSSAIDYATYTQILDLAIGDNTLLVGYSTTWLPFRIPTGLFDTDIQSRPDHGVEDIEFLEISKFKGTLVTSFAYGDPNPWLEYPKKINPKTKIVFGGVNIDMYIDFKLVDYYIAGFAETMVIDLLDKLSGKSKRIFNKILDYDQKAQTPVWDFRESKTTYTDYDFITKQEALSLEVSRGCRFKCAYCSFPLIGQKNMNDYLKHEHIIRDELLENYERWGTTKYYFMDDTFNDSTEKLEMMLRITRSLPFKISFWCYLRLDLLAVNPEQIPMLKEMGLSQCYFGLETFNPMSSKSIGKGMSAARRKATLQQCKECWGDTVSIQSGFIVGLPYETEQSIAETAEYLRQPDCPIDIAWLFPLSLLGDTTAAKYIHRSEFDRNYSKYGYYFPNPDCPWEWHKDDDTGIDSYNTAEKIASKFDVTIKKRVYKGDFYKSSLNHPVLSNRELTMSMTDDEYVQLLESVDQVDLYFKTIIEQYFNPLIEKLRGTRV